MNRLAFIFIIFMAFNGTASAGLLFNFSDNGGNTTLLTASGTLDLTGSTSAGTTTWNRFIGWDDNLGYNTGLVADSGSFLFNNPAPSISGFNSYNSIGTNTLSVGGNLLTQSSSLWMDGNVSSFSQFFALDFGIPLAQTGIVQATGSAVLNFSFDDLPYDAVTSLDLMQDQSVIFQFGAVAVAEPSIIALFGLGIFGLGLSRRRMKK